MKTSLAFLALSVASVHASAQDKPDAGKVSGTFFGDYYSVLDHHNGDIDKKSGTSLRRLYITFDKRMGDGVSGRLRIEARDPGDFTSTDNLTSFFKDAWVRYEKNGHKITFGLSPTPSFEQTEERLGYRPMEKTPIDLYKLGNPRDKGISIQGPIDQEGRFTYMVMVGDGSGTKSSTGNTTTFYGRLGAQVNEMFAVDVYADSWKKTGGVKWTTFKAEGYATLPKTKLGLSFTSQKRSKPDSDDFNIGVVSFYVEHAATDQLSPFVRLDVLDNPVPDADKIEYLSLSKDGKPTLLQVGVRVKLTDALEFVPNIEAISYRKSGDLATPGRDTFLKFTVNGKF